MSYDVNKVLNAEVTVTNGGFLVYVNNEFFHFYKARLPWETFVETKVYKDSTDKIDSSKWTVEEIIHDTPSEDSNQPQNTP